MSYYVLNANGEVTGMASHDFGLPGETYVKATTRLDQSKKWKWQNGQFVEVAPTQQELDQKAWERVRRERALKLQESDWTQLPDAPASGKQAWAKYRQDLRDITNQPDPLNIVWPTPPA